MKNLPYVLLELSIQKEEISKVVELITGMLKTEGLADDTANCISIGIKEMTENIMKCEEKQTIHMDIRCYKDKEKFVLSIYNDGPAFNSLCDR